MHPAGDIRGSKGDHLKGVKIVLCITGSIAAVETVKLARELIRFGADVHGVMTSSALEIIGKYSVEFATGNPVITELTGMVEHVSLLGDVPDRADLVLVAPSTANTIGKMVSGIDDTPVTTCLTTAIGTGIPVMVVPAMHETMYRHPVVQNNIDRARDMGISFIQPLLEENKAKMAVIPEIVENVIREMGGKSFNGRKVLIITGATREPIDDMRFLSNKATGRTGIYLAIEAFRKGADVLLMAGENVSGIPDHIQRERFTSTSDLVGRMELLTNEHGDFDIAFFVAGISDFSPEKVDGKISSSKDSMSITMSKTPKVVERFRKLFPETFLVGFKAESVDDEGELIRRAFRRMEDTGMNLIVANDLSGVTEEENTILTITPSKEVFKAAGRKEDLSRFLLDKCGELLASKGR
jgi:phosphopantothenoylcysteine decarboxylase/phosphopantothenate--cysteine ligase